MGEFDYCKRDLNRYFLRCSTGNLFVFSLSNNIFDSVISQLSIKSRPQLPCTVPISRQRLFWASLSFCKNPHVQAGNLLLATPLPLQLLEFSSKPRSQNHPQRSRRHQQLLKSKQHPHVFCHTGAIHQPCEQANSGSAQNKHNQKNNEGIY